MSRSRKKYPCSKDGKRRKKPYKQLANRKIRRSIRWKCFDIPNGGAYRQVSCSYYICDFRSVWTFRDSIKWHQAMYDKAVAEHDVEVAERCSAKDWRYLYRKWARYYLWK